MGNDDGIQGPAVPPVATGKNIYQRINAIMADVRYVKKDAKVSGGGASYTAVTHDQMLSVLRSALVAHGVVIVTDQVSGELLIKRDVENNVKMHLYAGRYAVAAVNVDKPDDRVIIHVDAHASDNGDKAPPKAMTQATKMAMLKLFSLETGDQEESRADWRESIDGEQAGEIKSLLESTNSDVKKFLTAFQIGSVDEMPRASFGRALGLLNKKREMAK